MKKTEKIEMKTVGYKENHETIKKGPKLGARHWQILLEFVLILVAYGVRVTLSVAIVAMTDPTASINPDVPTYPEWNDKSIMLSAFFWGYVIPQIFAGWITNLFGPKWFLVAAMAVCSLMGILLPAMAAAFGSWGVMASRAVQGLSQGFIFPAVHNLLSHWVPPEERSRLGTFVYAAGPFGTVVSMLVTGAISASQFGWPMVFYLYGSLGLVWCVLFSIFGYNTPAEHPYITQEEQIYIETSLGHTAEKPKHKTPWKKIWTSVPVWAILLTQCGQNWGFWTLMTEIPSYMSHVMNFNIKSNSILSALPYFVLWLLSFVMSTISDALVNKNVLSIGTSRKLFNTIGLCFPAVALIFLGLSSPDETKRVVTLLVLAVGMNSGIYCGFNVNHMDISPNHAGTLMGITNGLSNIFGILAPLVVQFIVVKEDDPEQWKIIFFLTAGIYIATNAIFIFFASGEVQPWNDDEEEKEKECKVP